MLIFGGDFINGYSILMILVIAAYIQAIFGIGGTTLIMTGFPKINMINTFIACALNICLNIILIPKIGFVGSAWATLACYFCMTVSSFIIGRKYFPIPYDLKRIFTYLGLSLLFYQISSYFETSMLINTIYLFVFLLIVFALEKAKKEVISEPELFD